MYLLSAETNLLVNRYMSYYLLENSCWYNVILQCTMSLNNWSRTFHSVHSVIPFRWGVPSSTRIHGPHSQCFAIYGHRQVGGVGDTQGTREILPVREINSVSSREVPGTLPGADRVIQSEANKDGAVQPRSGEAGDSGCFNHQRYPPGEDDPISLLRCRRGGAGAWQQRSHRN